MEPWYSVSHVWNAVTVISTIFSIIGFGITIYVAMNTRVIKRTFVNKMRLPQLHKELTFRVHNSYNFLKNYKDEEKNFRHELYLIKALVDNLIPKLNEYDAKKATSLANDLVCKKWYKIKSIDKVEIKSEEHAFELHSRISGLNSSLGQIVKDYKAGNYDH